jgi:intracellular protein transport protein USO1
MPFLRLAAVTGHPDLSARENAGVHPARCRSFSHSFDSNGLFSPSSEWCVPRFHLHLLTAAAGLLLLVDLTRSSIELQKLVAFESTFDRLFQLIDHDGVQRGGAALVSNCLRLFANLVRQNTTNQTLFRESGCVPKLSALLKSAYDTADAEKTGGQHNPERLDCVLGVLVLIRTFLVSGVVDTKVNQRAFERYGILQQVLDLAVHAAADPAVRVEVGLI